MPSREILQSLLHRLPDRAELGQIIRELGYFLPKATLPELRELRAEIATTRDHPEMSLPERAFLHGILFAMAEVCASYEAEIQADIDRRQRATFGIEKPLHNALLQKIFSGMTSPGDLAQGLGKDAGQISRALNELRSAGLIELVPASPMGDQRRRFYRLTTEGLRVLSAQGWPASPGMPTGVVVIEENRRRTGGSQPRRAAARHR